MTAGLRRARALLLVAAPIAIVASGLIALGRWEADRAIDGEREGMRNAFTAAGGRIDAARLSGYRAGPTNCFAYEVGSEPYAIQLCFDKKGRLVEAVDRRGTEPRYWWLTATPERAAIRVDPALIDQLLEFLSRS